VQPENNTKSTDAREDTVGRTAMHVAEEDMELTVGGETGTDSWDQVSRSM
jgi:hypothetical protein